MPDFLTELLMPDFLAEHFTVGGVFPGNLQTATANIKDMAGSQPVAKQSAGAVVTVGAFLQLGND